MRRFALGALAGGLLCLVVGVAPAAASCTGTPLTTCTFVFTGAEQSFTIPTGVASIHVVVIGARGGGTGFSRGSVDAPIPIVGGYGDKVEGDGAVGPGTTLPAGTIVYLEVGGNGVSGPNPGNCFSTASAGGFNGGAAAGLGRNCGGGGGGSSDIRTTPSTGTDTLTSRLVVAGGGGGAGGYYLAGDGGNAGVAGGKGYSIPGQPEGATGGGAGTSSAGGASGSGYQSGVSGVSGSAGSGGPGGSEEYPGGGGGGGYYGGGGGGSAAYAGGAQYYGGGGGGGGSSYASNLTSSSVATDTADQPSITISYHVPVLSVAGTLTKEATSHAGAVVTYTVTASDVDSVGAPNCTPASGSTFSIGTTTVNCSATDAAGNVGHTSFDVVVSHAGAPVLTLPAVVHASAVDASGANVTYTATALDVVDGAITPSCSPASGSKFALGTTAVTCTAHDLIGNTATGSFHVIVSDTTAPVITGERITGEAQSGDGLAVSYTVSATDNVDGAVAASCTPASGSTFAIGTTTVSCTASDKAGNVGTGSFELVISHTNAPVLALPTSAVAEATSASGAVVRYSVSARDLVDGAVTPSCSPASGSTFKLGTTKVTCTAKDKAGNSSTGSFDVLVRDTSAPTLTVPTALHAEATSSTGAVVRYAASARDVVDGAITPTCTPGSGSRFRIATTVVRCTARDKLGHIGSATFTVTVHPLPVIAKRVSLVPLRGRVLVKVPGARRYQQLKNVETLPLGTFVDATGGRVRATVAARRGRRATELWGGIGRLTQGRDAILHATLAGDLGGCTQPRSRKPKTRRLWASAPDGVYTQGRYAAARAAGTQKATWLTEDRCTSTLVRSTAKAVMVFGLPANRTVRLSAGRSFTANRP